MSANPELRASRFDIGMARGRLRQSSVLAPNPSADVLAGGEGAEIGFTQEIEIAGQRSARRAAANAGLERVTAGVRDVARLTIADVDRAFYRLVAATRRTTLAEEILGLNDRLADIAERQLAAGGISGLEYNLARVEFGRSRARSLAAHRELEETAGEFRQLLALPVDAAVIPIADEAPLPAIDSLVATAQDSGGAGPDSWRSSPARSVLSLGLDSLTALALARRPDLAARQAAARAAAAEVSVARREGFPNLAAGAVSERLDGGREIRPAFGVTLPLFNRNRGEVEARRAEAAQAAVEREAVAIRIRAEVARAARAYAAAAAEVEVLESTVLTPARENRRLLEIAFREGKVGLPVLLLIRNQVIDAELEYWEAWLAQHEAGVALAAATGETIIGFDPNAAAGPEAER